MKESRLDEWQQFSNYQKQRAEIKLSQKLQAMMDNCEYVLHTEFDKNTKTKHKHKRKNQQLSNQYKQAFKTLSRDQKLQYYLRYMKLIKGYLEGTALSPPQLKGVFSSDVYSRSFNLKMWKHKRMRLDRQKHILYAQKDNKIKTYVLEDYLLRKSKNKQYYSFVLEAVNSNPHQKSQTVHLGFKQETKLNEWYKQLNAVYSVIQWKFVWNQMKLKGIRSMTQSENFGKFGQLSSQRSKTNVLQLEDNMSKSVLIDKFKKNQIIFKQEQNYSKSLNQKTIQVPIQKKNTMLGSYKQPIRSMEIQQKSLQPQSNGKNSSFLQNQQQQFFSGEESDQQNEPQNLMAKRQTIIQQIAKIDDVDEIEAITQRQEKKIVSNQVKQDIFHRILPQYNLQQLENTVNFGTLHEEGSLKIYGHIDQPSKIKMFIQLPLEFSQKLILNALTQSETIKQSNSQIQQISLKTLIKSQNSAMMYLKIKAYNKLYRPRDFIFLRHAFTAHDMTYIIDKSIENVSYPPFTTIVRGELCVLWGIRRQNDRNSIIADIQIKNQGYLNDSQNVNLVLKYLKAFNIQKTIRRKQQILQNFCLFNDKWNIKEQIVYIPVAHKKRMSHEKGKKRRHMEKQYEIKLEPEQQIGFKKKKTSTQQKTQDSQLRQNKLGNKNIEEKKELKTQHEIRQQKLRDKVREGEKQLLKKYSHMQQQKGQIDLQEAQNNEKLKLMTVHGIKRQFDQKGFVIVSNSFIKTKYILSPQPKKQIVYQQAISGHPIWKGEWKHDDKVGGIIFINEKKIQDQKGVLKFILTKIGKNLLSGKSVLNISLPVDIFCAESNLERLVYSLTYAPTHLEPAVSLKSPLQRLKKIIAFGISNSPLYLNMQKPFNPILGQTFQCWIDGCPVYAQQISHHPPIAAILYEGRGFRMTAQLESKVQLHMNSGCGTNDGYFRIKFEDGMEGCYLTPGGEVSGLTYGDRKFNMVGKAYYWIESELLFLQIIFNPTRKGFFSVGKQQQPIDYFQGFVCKVKSQFMESFTKKRRAPLEKEITQKLGKVHGIWNKFVKYEQQTILDIQKQFPAKLQYEANPLPSDANWRQDIAYRRILQVSKSQSEKQRLQVLQRKDRKLRQANPNHQHHKK